MQNKREEFAPKKKRTKKNMKEQKREIDIQLYEKHDHEYGNVNSTDKCDRVKIHQYISRYTHSTHSHSQICLLIHLLYERVMFVFIYDCVYFVWIGGGHWW